MTDVENKSVNTGRVLITGNTSGGTSVQKTGLPCATFTAGYECHSQPCIVSALIHTRIYCMSAWFIVYSFFVVNIGILCNVSYLLL